VVYRSHECDSGRDATCGSVRSGGCGRCWPIANPTTGDVAPPPTEATVTPDAGTGTGTGTGTEVKTIVVPDVLGKYYVDAAQLITDAGLEPVDVSIHGPIDEDAGDIGTIYRQTPKAGESVPAGTKVELRSWWESQ
jgi:hypothetical protein